MATAIQRLTPKDRAAWLAVRRLDVTASQIGALFGAHEYLTALDLWANKTGRLKDTPDETPAMQRGRLLEPVAVQMLREKYPEWEIEHNAAENVYYRDPEHRLGATPDVIVRGNGGKGVVQIKSVEASIFRRKWLDDQGEVEPPLWIALQATLEAWLVNASWAAVAPLVVGHGLELPLIDIPLVPGVIDAMRERVAEFWRMVDEGREPPVDPARDGALLDRLYPHGDEQHEIDLSGDNRIRALIAERAQALTARREAETALETIDAEIKAKLGDATVAHLGRGRRITWLSVKKAGHFTPPSTYRQLRVPPPEKE